MNTPKISVIIPIYGTEEYLDKCLNSVRNQTFKDIEIICIDDCSPDDSYKIVEKHKKQDKRVVLIRHNKNLGLGGARNTAIRVAKADYIASVDSDDYMLPTMLETLWDATDNGWFDVVCCGFSRVNENDNILSKVEYEEKQVSNDDDDIDIFSILNPAFWNKLWRKSLFLDNDILFPEHDYYEDMSTTPRILAKSRYIRVIKNNLYRYLIREQSIMSGMSDKHVIDYLKGFEILVRFLDENNLGEHYAKELDLFIRNNILFYSKTILNSGLYIDKKIQYLRFLVLFRITFSENFNSYKKYGIDSLIVALGEKHLHGEYFNQHKKLHNKLNDREDYIARQIVNIKGKKELIDSNVITIKKLKKELDVSLSNFDQYKKEQAETKSYFLRFKKDLTKTQETLTKTEDHLLLANKTIKQQLKQLDGFEKGRLLEKKRIKKLIKIIDSDSDKIRLLEEELSKKISILQMSAVLIFAVVSKPILSKQRTLKLINRPRLFFRDSKSNFARRYASLFKLI